MGMTADEIEKRADQIVRELKENGALALYRVSEKEAKRMVVSALTHGLTEEGANKMKFTEYFWFPVLTGSAGTLIGLSAGMVLSTSTSSILAGIAGGLVVFSFYKWSKLK